MSHSQKGNHFNRDINLEMEVIHKLSSLSSICKNDYAFLKETLGVLSSDLGMVRGAIFRLTTDRSGLAIDVANQLDSRNFGKVPYKINEGHLWKCRFSDQRAGSIAR